MNSSTQFSTDGSGRPEWVTMSAVLLNQLLDLTTPETALPATRDLIVSSLRELLPYEGIIRADLDRLSLPYPSTVFGYFERMSSASNFAPDSAGRDPS